MSAPARRIDVSVSIIARSRSSQPFCAAADRGWIEKDRVMMESLLGIRRAGADFIVTYFATEAAKQL